MNISYTALYEEYGRCIKVQKDVIAHYREKLSSARRRGDHKETDRLEKMLYILYDEKCDLEESAGHLRKYLPQ